MEERFDSYAELRSGSLRLIRTAKTSLDIFDPTCKDLTLGSSETVDALTDLLRLEGTRIRLVTHDTGYLERDCPRFIRLLQFYGHKMSIHKTLESAKVAQDTLMIADRTFLLRRYHIHYPRGSVDLSGIAQCAPWQGRFDAIWEASEPAVSFTTLGL